jgi:hypothetical protein
MGLSRPAMGMLYLIIIIIARESHKVNFLILFWLIVVQKK